MTHGCLEIRAADDDRVVFLHTYHTGMDIPKAVEGAVEVLAQYNKYLIRFGAWQTVDDAIETFGRLCINQNFGYQPSAAALIIGAVPNFLEPFPKEFIDDLPEWGGARRTVQTYCIRRRVDSSR